MLPVTLIGGRYYGETDQLSAIDDNSDPGVRSKLPVEAGCVKHDPITPTIFCATRAKMVECAYRSGRAQALHVMARSDDS